MRLVLLTILTMFAFAGNSILTREALAKGEIGASEFSLIRLAAGFAALFFLTLILRKGIPKATRQSAFMALALLAYVIGFSFAYLHMDAGLGALILFGGVQITMMLGSAILGERILPMQIAGGAIAFLGLVILFAPGSLHVPAQSGLLMTMAAVSWGIYSLMGRNIQTPIPTSALNFGLAFAICVALFFILPREATLSARGVTFAVLSGAVTSGLGYALWYSILPKLASATAAVAQLSVPIIAMVMGAVFLHETISPRGLLSAALVICGIAIAIYARTRAAKAL